MFMTIGYWNLSNKLYVFEHHFDTNHQVNKAISKELTTLWHRQYGQLSFHGLYNSAHTG